MVSHPSRSRVKFFFSRKEDISDCVENSNFTLPTITAANLRDDMFRADFDFDWSSLSTNQIAESPHFSPVDVDRALKLIKPPEKVVTPKSGEKRPHKGSDIRHGFLKN